MSEQNNLHVEQQLKELYEGFAAGHVSRRDLHAASHRDGCCWGGSRRARLACCAG